MAKIIDLSKDNLTHSITKSISKKRNTLWQMMRCMANLKYKPSMLLVVSFVLCIAYLVSPYSLFCSEHVSFSFIDELLVLLVFFKILSHETHRFTRHKARTRRSCD